MMYIYIYKIFRLFRNFSIKDIDIYVEKTTDTGRQTCIHTCRRHICQKTCKQTRSQIHIITHLGKLTVLHGSKLTVLHADKHIDTYADKLTEKCTGKLTYIYVDKHRGTHADSHRNTCR